MILTGAAAASKGFEGFSVYSATKAAIRSFTRTWTVDLKRRKIRVNVISPGPIDTPIFRSVVQSEEQTYQLKTKLVSSVPLGQMGTPDEVAKAVSFLESDDSSFIILLSKRGKCYYYCKIHPAIESTHLESIEHHCRYKELFVVLFSTDMTHHYLCQRQRNLES